MFTKLYARDLSRASHNWSALQCKPHARLRAAITPAGRGRAAEPHPPKHHAMRWMQRLKRAFRIDIQTCQRCGGTLKVIASIEDPELIRRILDHLQGQPTEPPAPLARAPPAGKLPH